MEKSKERNFTLQFDPGGYRDYVEDFDMTPEQEADYLEALWSIVTCFVDLGFAGLSVPTPSRVLSPEELWDDSDELDDIEALAMVYSPDTPCTEGVAHDE